MTRESLACAVAVLLLSGSGPAVGAAAPTSDIYSIAVDGSDQRNLTNTPGLSEEMLSVSPDGTRLAFFQANWLVVTGTDGQKLRRIASYSQDDNFVGSPRWSPDGREIAYVQGFSCTGALCHRQELWVADVDNVGARGVLVGAVEPAWSPDGTRIAYSRARLGSTGREPIYRLSIVIARSDGSGRHTIARPGSGPAWSPSGRYLAFNGKGGLSRCRADGSVRRRLLKRPKRRTSDWIGDEENIAWSPDGRHLAFTGFTLNTGDGAYVIRPSGRGLRRLGLADTRNPVSWSPDGKSLVWPHPTRHGRLVVASVDGRTRRELRVAISTYTRSPVWSADGTRIFFAG